MKPINLSDAEAIRVRVCRNELGIAYANHFWDRLDERLRGFSFPHLMLVLRSGKIVDGPVRDDANNNYRITVEAAIADFGRVRVVLGIARNRDAVCITVIKK